MSLGEFGKALHDLWPLVAAIATLVTGWVIFKLKGIFATNGALEAERKRIAALETNHASMQTMLANALRDFERRTDAMAGKGALAETEQSTLRAHHRLDLLEQRMVTLPDAKDFALVRDSLAALDANSRELKARVETAVVGVKRIEDHLLSKSA